VPATAESGAAFALALPLISVDRQLYPQLPSDIAVGKAFDERSAGFVPFEIHILPSDLLLWNF